MDAIPYCGTCKKVLEAPQCTVPDHISDITNGPAEQFWLRRRSNLYRWAKFYSPMRWFHDWGNRTKGRAGVYIAARFVILVGLGFLASCVPSEWNICNRIIVHSLIGGFSLLLAIDILFVNTFTAFFPNPPPKSKLRSAIFLVVSYAELAIAYSVFYLISAGGFNWNGEANAIRALYFSFVTMATVGYGDVSPNPVWYAQLLVILEIATSFYFVTLLVATIINSPTTKQQ